jgi:2-C-methyl-D-erythritol 4-phosphate cytidylyltransferase
VKKYSIIVAGGSGQRFKSSVPKQFVELAGKPILMHSIEVFCKYDTDIEIIVVLPKEQIEYWKRLCEKFSFNIEYQIVDGGITRFDSVKNGLSLVKPGGIVGIHDGVRPLVDLKTIEICYNVALKAGNAIPVVELIDSVREIREDGTNTHVDRSKFRLIQTPQVFKSELILKAYEQKYSPLFTDDASVLESMMPGTIQLVEGNRQNIKITTADDLKYAEMIIKNVNDLI